MAAVALPGGVPVPAHSVTDVEFAQAQLCTGYHSISDFLISAVDAGHKTLAICDCYSWWNAHGEADFAGKLLVFDPSDTSVHHVFFDDNIQRDHAKIVDARHSVTGEHLPFDSVKGVYLIRAVGYECILNKRYFIEQLEHAEALRTLT